MPTYVAGNLWEECDRADLLLVTTNATINMAGRLVMGRGAAKDLADAQPDFPRLAAMHLTGARGDDHIPAGVLACIYGVRCIRQHGRTMYGLFQVKRHWQQGKADLALIAWSAGALSVIARDYKRVAMNFPGIGNGRLLRETVLPILEPLPKHIYIYEPE